MQAKQSEAKSLLRRYIIGFVVSLGLTLLMYLIATHHAFVGLGLVIVLGVLALFQMVLQLLLFLHVGDESRPRYKLAALTSMVVVLVIVVVGSLWIMHHLNSNMLHMTPEQKADVMYHERDKGF